MAQFEQEGQRSRIIQLKADEAFAMKLLLEEKEAEERKRLELERDLKLALQLQEEDHSQSCTQTKLDDLSRKSRTYVPRKLDDLSTKSRTHALSIHDKFCGCGLRETQSNNHIYHVHNTNCTRSSCPTNQYLSQSSGRMNNAGEKHLHSELCCTLNHLHTIACQCTYRNHVYSGHGPLCCPLQHVHDRFCHCVFK
eukprot:TRINITY_DN915_c0_g1_i5.p1 TRINITY_DN915_c0_g1~~TRINITY_DN915_c0_g1_i5.p1  ORF type:complete len:195 (-),score=26.34 TRINITY_DN915_c0_g1_i5:323-907(-)